MLSPDNNNDTAKGEYCGENKGHRHGPLICVRCGDENLTVVEGLEFEKRQHALTSHDLH